MTFSKQPFVIIQQRDNVFRTNWLTVQTLSCSDLETHLVGKGFDVSLAAKIKDEEIDRESFLALTDMHFLSMGFKIGQKMKMENYIKRITKRPVFPCSEKLQPRGGADAVFPLPSTSSDPAPNSMQLDLHQRPAFSPQSSSSRDLVSLLDEEPSFNTIEHGYNQGIHEFDLFLPPVKIFGRDFLCYILNRKRLKQNFQESWLKSYTCLLLSKHLRVSTTEMLHPAIAKNKKVPCNVTQENFILFREGNVDLLGFTACKPFHLVQPFLVCLGTIEEPNALYFFVADHELPPDGQTTRLNTIAWTADKRQVFLMVQLLNEDVEALS
ncbi:Uncharacterized protein APZ42_014439 [Daphnia magna]|uniref:SAM domain-containing protein n=1 Tax=Daphnia magna TaxID=35525 RepID=A0A162PW78_9CRUS|nr:Uncharacterized protein APZ42_014439 [Daphnia magna]